MEPKSVALIDLGEELSISLDDLTDILNSIQGGFDFVHAGTVTFEVLGDPDVEEVWYSTGSLFNVLCSNVPIAEFDLVVGVTHLPLARTDETGKTIDKNYFSLSDLQKLTVVSADPQPNSFQITLENRYSIRSLSCCWRASNKSHRPRLDAYETRYLPVR